MEYGTLGYEGGQAAANGLGYAAKQQPNAVNQPKSFDRCIADAGAIREQIAECAKLAAIIRERLSGSYPEEGCDRAAKELPAGGVVGELSRIQTSTFEFVTDLRRALEQISKHV